jgi:hypothetical protein
MGVMSGVRVLEVAEHTFVPAASAVLADWGAEVIKVEHVERGDAMRGIRSTGVMDLGTARICFSSTPTAASGASGLTLATRTAPVSSTGSRRRAMSS